MSSLWHAAISSLLMAWLCTAFAWGVAGAALASWGRLPVWVGAMAGAVFPILGAAGVGALALTRAGRASIGSADRKRRNLGLTGAKSKPEGWTLSLIHI